MSSNGRTLHDPGAIIWDQRNTGRSSPTMPAVTVFTSRQHRAGSRGFVSMLFRWISPAGICIFHDKESKDFWSTSWQPVGKPLKDFKTECRHGSAYTKISSEYSGIKSETLYFVPLGKNYECWLMNLKNTGKKKRALSAFTYVEYANNWHITQDMINLQYTQFIMKMDVVESIIDHRNKRTHAIPS